jgi:predicted aldo/keto reductase-like oxidoreductase
MNTPGLTKELIPMKTRFRQRCCGYVRVTTEEQFDTEMSARSQQRRLRRYASEAGMNYVRTVVDSGVAEADVARIIAANKREGFDVLVMVSLDRLASDSDKIKSLSHGLRDEGIVVNSLDVLEYVRTIIRTCCNCDNFDHLHHRGKAASGIYWRKSAHNERRRA